MSLVMVSSGLAAANARAPATIRLAYPRITDTSGALAPGLGSPYWAWVSWIAVHMSAVLAPA